MSKTEEITEEKGYAVAHSAQRYFLTGLKRTRDQAIDECIDMLWGSAHRKDKYMRAANWRRARDEGWYAARVRMTEIK